MAVLVLPIAYFVYIFMTGNPTQRVNKLFDMMNKGMAGGEDAFAFDKVSVSRLMLRILLSYFRFLPSDVDYPHYRSLHR